VRNSEGVTLNSRSADARQIREAFELDADVNVMAFARAMLGADMEEKGILVGRKVEVAQVERFWREWEALGGKEGVKVWMPQKFGVRKDVWREVRGEKEENMNFHLYTIKAPKAKR